EVRVGFHLRPGQAGEITALLDALSGVGFPPVSVRVARMAAGVPFRLPIPRDGELVDAEGAKPPSGTLRTPGRPVGRRVVPCKGKDKQGKDEQTDEARPADFARLNEVAGKYAGRADFVAVSSRKDDAFADARALWRRANMSFPVLHDPEQKLATALSAGT